MQVRINTDDNVKDRDALARWVEAEVDATLGRFGGRLSRVEGHLIPAAYEATFVIRG